MLVVVESRGVVKDFLRVANLRLLLYIISAGPNLSRKRRTAYVRLGVRSSCTRDVTKLLGRALVVFVTGEALVNNV